MGSGLLLRMPSTIVVSIRSVTSGGITPINSSVRRYIILMQWRLDILIPSSPPSRVTFSIMTDGNSSHSLSGISIAAISEPTSTAVFRVPHTGLRIALRRLD